MNIRLIKKSGFPVITLLLIIVNAVAFLTFGLKDLSAVRLLDLGANFAPFSLSSEPHRLFTSMFLHGGFIHMLTNLYGLYVAGGEVEKKVGMLPFLFIYLLTGLAAGLASLYFNLFTISVGASGAIFGVYGFLVVLSIRDAPEN